VRRRSWLELSGALALAGCVSSSSQDTTLVSSASPAPQALPFDLVDALPAFFGFFESFEDGAVEEQIEGFFSEVVAKHPAVYAANVLGLSGPDPRAALTARLRDWLPGVAARVPAMRAVHARFPQDAQAAVTRFRQVLPSFGWRGKCWLFASVDGMNGGVREVGGESSLVFGVDVIVKDASSMPLPVLFAHELFHVHHAAQQPDPGSEQRIVDALWFEGLATYASTLIVPGTTDRQALPLSHVHEPDSPALDNPARRVDLAAMPLELRRSLGAELHAALESQERDRYSDFFLGRASPRLGERPVRSGYWFGLMVARALGKTRGLDELTNADMKELRPLIASELSRLVA
jgi:hypothetical protein